MECKLASVLALLFLFLSQAYELMISPKSYILRIKKKSISFGDSTFHFENYYWIIPRLSLCLYIIIIAQRKKIHKSYILWVFHVKYGHLDYLEKDGTIVWINIPTMNFIRNWIVTLFQRISMVQY